MTPMDATVAPPNARLLAHHEARAIVCGVLLPILAGARPTIGRELGQVHALLHMDVAAAS